MQIEIGTFPFDAVLWDMDGSLIDSEPIWIEEETLLMREFGVEWNEEDSLICLGGPMQRVDEYMRSRAGYRHQPMELSSILLDRMALRLRNGVPYAPGAGELLREFLQMNLPMGIVTASTRKILNSVLDSIGHSAFGIAIADDDVMKSKPDAEGYLKAASSLKVPIERTLIIEDSVTGTTAAIASGAWVLAIEHLVELPFNERTLRRISLNGVTVEKLTELFAPLVRG